MPPRGDAAAFFDPFQVRMFVIDGVLRAACFAVGQWGELRVFELPSPRSS
jgi:hypothetical protein